MLKILEESQEGNILIRKYTRDGITISHIIKSNVHEEGPIEEPTEPTPTLEEQILAENQYQTALLEMQMLGGM